VGLPESATDVARAVHALHVARKGVSYRANFPDVARTFPTRDETFRKTQRGAAAAICGVGEGSAMVLEEFLVFEK